MSLPLVIRPMTEADLPQVMVIENKGHAFPWTQGIMAGNLGHGYVCRALVQGERVLGYAIVQHIVDEAHLLNITIDPALQGKGYGRHLLRELIEETSDQADTMFLEVRPSNTSAIALYQSMGFNEIGLRKNYYPAVGGGREDAMMMALVLGSPFK